MKVLFISHNAQRAGAQLLLLQFLRWLKINKSDIEIQILLIKSGPLFSDFQYQGKTYLYPQNTITQNPILKLYIKYKQNNLFKNLANQNFDIIYNNTILNTSILERLSFFNVPIITHAHEMTYWLDQMNEKELSLLKKFTNYFFTASNSVAVTLIEKGVASTDNTYPVYVFADDEFLSNRDLSKSLKKYLKLPEDAILIGACGAESFRKGKDWFIPIATSVLSKRNLDDIHFVWIGGKLDDQIQFDLNNCGFSSQIHFIDHLPNAGEYFHELSLFLMISREDPFPIVNIEVAMQGISILAFKNSGGTQELLKDFPDLLLPYGNISLMADRIISLLSNKYFLHLKGSQLKELVKSRYTINRVAEDIYGKMFEFMIGERRVMS